MRDFSGANLCCEFVIGRSERCGAKRAYTIEVEVQGIDYCRSLCRTHLTAVIASSRVAGRNLRIERAGRSAPGHNVLRRSSEKSRARFEDGRHPLGGASGSKRLSIYRDRLSEHRQRAEIARVARYRLNAF